MANPPPPPPPGFFQGGAALDLPARRPIHVVLDNVRSAFNVGSIFRTSDAAGIAHLHLCGWTAWPPHPKIEKTSLGSHEWVPWSRYERTEQAIADLKARGIPIVGLETCERAVSLSGFAWPYPVAVVFGHEIVGIMEEIERACDQLVRIPMVGHKNSINVASAFAVVAYDILRTWQESGRI